MMAVCTWGCTSVNIIYVFAFITLSFLYTCLLIVFKHVLQGWWTISALLNRVNDSPRVKKFLQVWMKAEGLIS